jgi:hypothetical protein
MTNRSPRFPSQSFHALWGQKSICFLYCQQNSSSFDCSVQIQSVRIFVILFHNCGQMAVHVCIMGGFVVHFKSPLQSKVKLGLKHNNDIIQNKKNVIDRKTSKVTIKNRQTILQRKHKQTQYYFAIWVVCALQLHYVKKVRVFKRLIFKLVTGLQFFSWTKTIRNKLFSTKNVDCKSAKREISKK